jgi:hypothetical protein
MVKIEPLSPLPTKSAALLREVGVAMDKQLTARVDIIRTLRSFARKADDINAVDKIASTALGALSIGGKGLFAKFAPQDSDPPCRLNRLPQEHHLQSSIRNSVFSESSI